MNARKTASKPPAKRSKKGAAHDGDEPLLDFLYVDRPRIALFLSQFNSHGPLTALARSVTTGSISSGGFDVKLAKIEGTDSEQTAISKQYDPQWLQPLVFRDELLDKGILKKGLDGARIGQIVEVTGSLRMVDLEPGKKIIAEPWMKPILAKAIAQIPQPEMVVHVGEKPVPIQTTPEGRVDLLLGFLGLLPYPVHMTMSSADGKAWGCLATENVVVSTTDLLLKHGTLIPGEWTIIGIIDGLANEPEVVQPVKKPSEIKMMDAVDKVAAVARLALGRPRDAYAVTPLLIYREVSV